jgi:hypothetical protein
MIGQADHLDVPARDLSRSFFRADRPSEDKPLPSTAEKRRSSEDRPDRVQDR